MTEELKKPKLFLVKVEKKLCHKGPLWQSTLSIVRVDLHGEQAWSSGESTRLSPMWPRFKSWCQCHMWVEFVVGSLPNCSEGFFSASGCKESLFYSLPLGQVAASM